MRLHNQEDFHQKDWWNKRTFWWRITWNSVVISVISLVLIIIYLSLNWDWVFGLR